ncbi:O-methyltransferase [Neoehrlichia mikurensis]|uniref:O-methyltransferase n=1 Tax=Neoehrlichia mikurensis TaxID=89586 RepID=A0A9Q9BXN3_9RICK|nr:O-methyltransferase [Neoehrlichia mikurensis]QXK92047.1 O-methyltransferase [Neoehrlichia mikurensis]QXK92504.1 O-methyltransferase [Neoehrlichia mikurensis]QXK93740.1 O-methyltransferase [Neoehrlichia mikurensis]UTO55288.1 O-methyltransferase [Neoehrlichia mikurensis]UTO56208.1 O-methyltransferase [Neoehrlichia mikurensis]
MRDKILDKRSQYINDLFSINDQDIIDAHSSTSDQHQFMQLSLVEGQILQLLIQMSNVKSIVEIGTFIGYSAICMAKALPKDGHLYTIEKKLQYIHQAKENIKKCHVSDRITIIHGDAQEQLASLSQFAPFDMIFIDANKSQYHCYLDWAEIYIKQNGLIIADNAFLFDSVFDNTIKISQNSYKSIINFTQRIANKNKFLSTLIPTKEGMIIALKL